jgi:hypothetical protein
MSRLVSFSASLRGALYATKQSLARPKVRLLRCARNDGINSRRRLFLKLDRHAAQHQIFRGLHFVQPLDGRVVRRFVQ